MGIYPKILQMVYGVKCVAKSVEILGGTPTKILQPEYFILNLDVS